MKLIITVLLLSVLVACNNNPDKKTTDSQSTLPKEVVESKITVDTVIASFPVQIGNDKGFVKLYGARTYENKKLTSSTFRITLKEIRDFSVSKQIDKSILIDSNETVHLKDTINSDYLDKAVIKNIEFDFVRSNTLYFKALLENSTDNKEILGRFNLFYRTKKQGQIYGWITDEVKETLPNKE